MSCYESIGCVIGIVSGFVAGGVFLGAAWAVALEDQKSRDGGLCRVL